MEKELREKSREIFAKITELLSEIKRIAAFGVKFGGKCHQLNISNQYIQLCGFDPSSAVRGRGHHKTQNSDIMNLLRGV